MKQIVGGACRTVFLVLCGLLMLASVSATMVAAGDPLLLGSTVQAAFLTVFRALLATEGIIQLIGAAFVIPAASLTGGALLLVDAIKAVSRPQPRHAPRNMARPWLNKRGPL